ncbi:MAG TPA: F0F1 ATP synthase subunit epsilon [Alphaproteobacteria bacterium]|nr:F0F1 ATP synthase subunit epsilon [Alphaproteobacteria bacterium]
MAGKLHFDLVSPERLLLSEDVDMVVAPGVEGEFGVLLGHAPLVTVLRPGVVSVHDEKAVRRIFVRGGFAEVNAAGLTVLAEEAFDLAEVNVEVLNQRIKNAEEDLADAQTDAARTAAQANLEGLRVIRDSL